MIIFESPWIRRDEVHLLSGRNESLITKSTLKMLMLVKNMLSADARN
jgi:hypothetical protein